MSVSNERKQSHEVVIRDLPLAVVPAMKLLIWELLDGPDVSGEVVATVHMELDITSTEAKRLSDYLDAGFMSGWVNPARDRR